MGKSKKTEVKNAEPKVSKKDEGAVEARPIGQGKDPLAEGNTLHNPTNTEAETHYEVKEKSEDVTASEIAGKDANERAEAHNSQLTQGAPDHDTPNQSGDDQAEVVANRVEPGTEQEADDTPEDVEVPEVSEEDQAKATEERDEALAKDRKTFS